MKTAIYARSSTDMQHEATTSRRTCCMKLISGAIGVLTVALLALSMPANSAQGLMYERTGDYLLTACKQALNATDTNQPWSAEATYCATWLDGFVTGSRLTTLDLGVLKYGRSATSERVYGEFGTFCMPDDVRTVQIIRVVVHFLETHPNSLNQDSGVLTVLALKLGWPCKSKTK